MINSLVTAGNVIVGFGHFVFDPLSAIKRMSELARHRLFTQQIEKHDVHAARAVAKRLSAKAKASAVVAAKASAGKFLKG